MNKPTIKKLILAIVILTIIAIVYSQFGEYASLDYIKSKQTAFKEYYGDNKVLVIGIFFLSYIAVTALSLPGAALMTLLAGALFGVVIGVVVVSFASSIGATCAFLAARFLLGDSLRQKYGEKDMFIRINEGITKEGAFYLFAMRLVPAFPFFLVNLLMSLTSIRTFTFYWASQLGMFAGTIVYVFAGTELADIESLGDILSPTLIGAFVAIGLLPFIAKKAVALLRTRKTQQP